MKLCRKRLDTGIQPSLPVRERGLKLWGRGAVALRRASLPVRERGLKQYIRLAVGLVRRSLPVRERGLKHTQAF